MEKPEVDMRDYDIGNASFKDVLNRHYGVEWYLKNPKGTIGFEELAEVMGSMQKIDEEESDEKIQGIACSDLWCVRVGRIVADYSVGEDLVRSFDAKKPLIIPQWYDKRHELEKLVKEKAFVGPEHIQRVLCEYGSMIARIEDIRKKRYYSGKVISRLISAATIEEASHAFGDFKHPEENEEFPKEGPSYDRVIIRKFCYGLSCLRPTVNTIVMNR